MSGRSVIPRSFVRVGRRGIRSLSAGGSLGTRPTRVPRDDTDNRRRDHDTHSTTGPADRGGRGRPAGGDPPRPRARARPRRPRISLAVSTYSDWHFKPDKYPIEKVIENAAAIGFEGVEILRRQMKDETPAYVNGLKKAAFRAGLSFPMLSIHQDFVSPDPMERQRHVDITTRSLQLAADLGSRWCA